MKVTVERACAVLTALLLVGCSSPQPDGGDLSTEQTPVISGEPAGYNAEDVAFATAMVAHHRDVIELAALAREQSANPRVQAMAEQIAAEAQPEINVLNVFLVQWDETPELGHPSESESDGAVVERLRSVQGAEFDRLWLDSMIAHHREAVAAAREEIADGHNVDAVAMARQTVAAQEAEIDRMGQLQEELP